MALNSAQERLKEANAKGVLWQGPWSKSTLWWRWL
jgi:hypothetical protein